MARDFTPEQRALADRVRVARENRKWSQARLAEEAGIGSTNTVGNFELYHSWPHRKYRDAMLRVLEIDEKEPTEAVNGLEPFDICPRCEQVIWPESYQTFFMALGGAMRALPEADRRQLVRRITQREVLHIVE